MGLCFSVKKGVKVPPSLANMYKSLESDPKISGFKTPKHGDLTHWANQGDLLKISTKTGIILSNLLTFGF